MLKHMATMEACLVVGLGAIKVDPLYLNLTDFYQ
jgi:hypothetical protein